MKCDHCGEATERRVKPGFWKVDQEVRARMARERRAYFLVCAPCCQLVQGGQTLGVLVTVEETTRPARCGQCFMPAWVRVQVTCTRRPDGSVTRRHGDGQLASQCACLDGAQSVAA